MAQKKRGANPIRITLTEDQISDIIQSAAKTRRGLRVENLEDRIAPSAIGAPIFDPSLSGDAPPPVFDPLNPPLPPLQPLPGDGFIPPPVPTYDPISGDSLVPPPLPGGPGLPGEPPLPFPGTPDATFDGSVPPVGIPGDPLHPITAPGDLTSPGSFRLQHQQDVFAQHNMTLPVGGDPGLPNGYGGDVPVDPTDYQQANHQITIDTQISQANGGAMPTADEIDEHRRNILRQLRGA